MRTVAHRATSFQAMHSFSTSSASGAQSPDDATALHDAFPSGRIDAEPGARERVTANGAHAAHTAQAAAPQDALAEACAAALVVARTLSARDRFQVSSPGGPRGAIVEVDATRPLSALLDAARRVLDAAVAPVSPDLALIALDERLDEARPLAIGVDADGAIVVDGDARRFDRAALETFAASIVRVRNASRAASGTPVGRLDAIGADARAWMAGVDGTTRAPAAAGGAASVTARFAACVRRSPNATALAWSGGALDFAALDGASDALASRMARAGVGPGAVVGLVLERGPAAIVALLAILKRGAAYLPIEPSTPAERLALMLGDAGARACVIAEVGGPSLPSGVVAIGVVETPTPGAADGAPGIVDVDGDAVAYVMYTSGSTGTPKGVRIRHRAILRLVEDGVFMPLGPSTRMLQAAPLGFDASTLEIWGPLLNGGTCVLHPEAVPTATGLRATITAHRVDAAWLTASLFNTIVDEDPSALAGLSHLLTGGEALSVPHVRRAAEALPGTTLVNGYGPTECTTFATTHAVPRDGLASMRSVPIGRPIASTTVHVLNARLEPVLPGFVGELCVGGDGLALDYAGRPDLTAERFVETDVDGAQRRLYRTGDLVRWRADGTLEYVGRRDRQIKLRGFRIELGEIEAAIAARPGVRACAVVARSDGALGTRLVAYVVLQAAGDIDAPALREAIGRVLPPYMVPSAFVALDALPVTPNGKLDQRALPAPSRARPELARPRVEPDGAAERAVAAVFAEVLGLDDVGATDPFFELGGNSLAVAAALAAFARAGLGGLRAADFYDDPTPRALAARLSGQTPVSASTGRDRSDAPVARDEPIAIVGMALRVPGASDPDTFWANLVAGVDSITRFERDQLDPSIPDEVADDPAYVRARGVIDDVGAFDAAFFGISPKEADLLDPQQRIFLELCWECMERAGHAPGTGTGSVGVFAGVYNSTYFRHHVLAHPDRIAAFGEFQTMLANEKDYVATRVAHRLGLDGPAVNVFTACSTSLVAMAMAVDALRAGRCAMALAGGAAVTCPPASGYVHQEGAMLSPDGRTRPFSAQAGGTVFSDGAAVLLLRRLSDALADGDTIHAIVRGVAINNDGGDKASFTAPSVRGQEAVVAAALREAGVAAREVDYVEAHGTATPLGDPAEVEALTRAFRRDTDGTGWCRLGSVKSNVGHTVMAAGALGVIKTALAMRHQMLPATLYHDAPNPHIDFQSTPFVVVDRASAWPRGARRRIAGVSSFGVGGTNAHAVLEEPPPTAPATAADGPGLLRLSARSPQALEAAALRLADHLERAADVSLEDVAHTLKVGRRTFGHRLAVVATDRSQALQALREADSPARAPGRPLPVPAALAFVFPGQGAQYPGMGAGLARADAAFASALDACLDAFRGRTDVDLRAALRDGDAALLARTEVTQPATFAIGYATARMWLARGLDPTALAGHSVGEWVAAALAGVVSLEDAAALVARRGALMQSCAPGRMLAVRRDASEIAGRLPQGVGIAAINAPGACVVSGPFDAVDALRAALAAQGIDSRELATSHAFHSPMMAPAVEAFADAVAAVRLAPPRIPIVSTATGAWLTDAEATDPGYWSRQIRDTVRFSDAVAVLAESPARVLLECGPRATLTGFVRSHARPGRAVPPCVPTLPDRPEAEAQSATLAVGRLWTLGIEAEPEPARGARRRVELPPYPFERRRHWLDAVPAPRRVAAEAAPASPAPAEAAAAAEAPIAGVPMPPSTPDRTAALTARLRALLEDLSGIEFDDASRDLPFVELGLDSLTLTQAALQLKTAFKVPLTFRDLMERHRSLGALARHLDAVLPAEAPAPAQPPASASAPRGAASPSVAAPATAAAPVAAALPVHPTSVPAASASAVERLVEQQLALMREQLALLRGDAGAAAPVVSEAVANAPSPAAPPAASPPTAPAVPQAAPATSAAADPSSPAAASDDDAPVTRYDVRKAFGAIARIHTAPSEGLTPQQRARLDAFVRRYVERTRRSKDYTERHRDHLADPRVVNGFRPLLKEIVYQIVIERSRGARMWDLDGNEYVDALNGFGMSLFGWQPEFVTRAVLEQIERGYDIGPQHPLAGEVAALVCELTGFDRAALCNTGSEAVMGCLRIARTVTGRSRIVIFSGAYHGIFDEVIVRATRRMTAVPAAPGILPNTAENVVVLEYGTPAAMQWLREHPGEIAAVLVEPVQSRRPDFQPKDFLRELRAWTADDGALLVFDEVVTGFRAHPGGIQALFDIRADLASYGKVVGGGFPIGVIAGRRDLMDALDGGHWRFGDDSIPTVGVTYFAGTFVRHPLALAAAKAVLEHLKAAGPDLQATLTRSTAAMVDELNAFCREEGAPITLKSFASVWKVFFDEDHPLQDLLFAMMRSRGVHVLDNFPCFMTTAHGAQEIAVIKTAFKEAVGELQEAGFLPRRATRADGGFDASRPPVPGARLGRDRDGRPAWFVANPDVPGKYLKLDAR